MKAGTKLKSTVCETEVLVVKASPSGVLTCGGSPLVQERPAERGEIDPAFAGGTQLGKRYTNPEQTIEVLCIKPGAGSLALDGVALSLKEAKPLPASD